MGERLQRGMRKLSGVMGRATILIVLMVLQIYILTKLNTLNMSSLLYVCQLDSNNTVKRKQMYAKTLQNIIHLSDRIF